MPRKLDPVRAKENMIAKGVWPISDFPQSGAKWLSVCMQCGSFVTPGDNNVMRPGRGGCGDCVKRNAAEKRRIPHEVAVEVMRATGVEPLEDFPGVDAPWRCRCLNALCPGLWMGILLIFAHVSLTPEKARNPPANTAPVSPYALNAQFSK